MATKCHPSCPHLVFYLQTLPGRFPTGHRSPSPCTYRAQKPLTLHLQGKGSRPLGPQSPWTHKHPWAQKTSPLDFGLSLLGDSLAPPTPPPGDSHPNRAKSFRGSPLPTLPQGHNICGTHHPGWVLATCLGLGDSSRPPAGRGSRALGHLCSQQSLTDQPYAWLWALSPSPFTRLSLCLCTSGVLWAPVQGLSHE